jgi:glycosyltransferase involved in cell wall biosynthesis
MFTELTRSNGSSRVVCYQFEQGLLKRGIRVHFYPPAPDFLTRFCLKIRRSRFLELMLKAAFWWGMVVPIRCIQILLARHFDIIFIQRGLLNYSSAPWLERALYRMAKHRNQICVYSLDDAQYCKTNNRFFIERFRGADWVLTGNQLIADVARTYNPNVFIFQSRVDVKAFWAKQHRNDGVIRIGWVGTLLHGEEPLNIVEDALQRLLETEDCEFVVISNRPWGFRNGRMRTAFVPWTLDGEVQNICRLDIGIMPVEDNEYGRSKEGYKLKQYMAAGLPTVCSPVGRNLDITVDGVTGFFASSPLEWHQRLHQLVCDCELRARMGAAARERILKYWDLESGAATLSDWFAAINASHLLPRHGA